MAEMTKLLTLTLRNLLHVVASSHVALTASSAVSESVKDFRAAINDPSPSVV